MLSSAYRCWCLAWCSRRFTVSRPRLTTCISKCAAGWQPAGRDDFGKSHLRWRLPCNTFKISVYESAGAVKHPGQTSSQVLLYLESMQERWRGRQRFTKGRSALELEPLTLSLILNEVEGYRAQVCTGPVCICGSTAEADRSSATFNGGVECVRASWVSLKVRVSPRQRRIKKVNPDLKLFRICDQCLVQHRQDRSHVTQTISAYRETLKCKKKRGWKEARACWILFMAIWSELQVVVLSCNSSC